MMYFVIASELDSLFFNVVYGNWEFAKSEFLLSNKHCVSDDFLVILGLI